MSKKKIITYGDPVLRKKAALIEDITDDIIAIANDMIETMLAAPGIGLAANQIGIAKQIIVADLKVKSPEEKPIAIINPKIVYSEGEEIAEEGCLSFPEINIDIRRAVKINVQGIGLDGKKIELEETGLAARIFQHEIDHINGVLFIDHINFVKKQLLRKDLRRIEDITRNAEKK
ncbi:peptide deformylase [Candidatus Poribacteria bacterium]|nr:peptide deformylase [Candidatus Poribacteria bacterium]